MGEWRYSSTILDFDTRWRLVVGFKPLSLKPRGMNPQYPLDRRLGESQNRSGGCGEEKNLALPGIEPGPFSLYPIVALIVEWSYILAVLTLKIKYFSCRLYLYVLLVYDSQNK
jgi:hypothetical protein